MNTKTVNPVFFSPTETTQAIVQAISEGTQQAMGEASNLTLPSEAECYPVLSR